MHDIALHLNTGCYRAIKLVIPPILVLQVCDWALHYKRESLLVLILSVAVKDMNMRSTASFLLFSVFCIEITHFMGKNEQEQSPLGVHW